MSCKIRDGIRTSINVKQRNNPYYYKMGNWACFTEKRPVIVPKLKCL